MPGMIGVEGLPIIAYLTIAVVCLNALVMAGVSMVHPREPGPSAWALGNMLVAVGVTSILNFAPAQVQVPAGIFLRKVDLSTELQILSFHEQRRAAVDLVRQVAARHRSADAGPGPGPEARD